MNRQKLPIHNVLDKKTPPTQPEAIQDDEHNAFDSTVDDLIAVFQKLGNGRSKAKDLLRQKLARPPAAGPSKPRKCQICCEEHANRVCAKPSVAFSDRKCFNCKKLYRNNASAEKLCS